MTRKARIRQDYEKILNELRAIFKDETTALNWLTLRHAEFKGLSAIEMIYRGKGEKVLRFMKAWF